MVITSIVSGPQPARMRIFLLAKEINFFAPLLAQPLLVFHEPLSTQRANDLPKPYINIIQSGRRMSSQFRMQKIHGPGVEAAAVTCNKLCSVRLRSLRKLLPHYSADFIPQSLLFIILRFLKGFLTCKCTRRWPVRADDTHAHPSLRRCHITVLSVLPILNYSFCPTPSDYNIT